MAGSEAWFVDVWEGLNVRLAISEGDTAMSSGQISMMIHSPREWLLQGAIFGAPLIAGFGEPMRRMARFAAPVEAAHIGDGGLGPLGLDLQRVLGPDHEP